MYLFLYFYCFSHMFTNYDLKMGEKGGTFETPETNKQTNNNDLL